MNPILNNTTGGLFENCGTVGLRARVGIDAGVGVDNAAASAAEGGIGCMSSEGWDD